MQWIVLKIMDTAGAPPRRASPARTALQELGIPVEAEQAIHDLPRTEYVKNYHTSRASADAYAKELAMKSPGTQYGIFMIDYIIETTAPNFVEKVVNSSNEIVIREP